MGGHKTCQTLHLYNYQGHRGNISSKEKREKATLMLQ